VTEASHIAAGAQTTVSIESVEPTPRARAVPGAVLIFAESFPRATLFRASVESGGVGTLELGRAELAIGSHLDSMISRRHLRLSFEGSRLLAADLGSRNGTFVNGQRLSEPVDVPLPSILRVGGAVLVAVPDILPFEHYGLGARDGVVGGPGLRKALDGVGLSQTSGPWTSLLVTGESGTGKEVAAQAFHAAVGRQESPFIAVHCATIPKDTAERLLFGARRGTFSVGTQAAGYVQSANGGTLFLDEVAELPLDVQSKLVRMLETREVQRLGATTTERVDVRVCAATWRDLRAEVGTGRFREDLYHRIGQPEVRLPALRERREEIPWHVQLVLDELGRNLDKRLSASAAFIEACALRMWPGNVRELRAEVRRTVSAAAARPSSVIGVEDLGDAAGAASFGTSGADPQAPFPKDEVALALESEGGNVASAARRLGVHRNKVRRWLERYQIDAGRFKAERKPESA
jgi:MoxR-like ATPase